MKRTRPVRRLRKPAGLPRIAPVGPSRRPPSNAELPGMLSECGQREHSDAVVRATLDEAAQQRRRTVETEVLGRYDLVGEETYTDGATVPGTATASGHAWTSAGRGRRSCSLESTGATHLSPAHRAPATGREAICNIRRKICSPRCTALPRCGACGRAGGKVRRGCSVSYTSALGKTGP